MCKYSIVKVKEFVIISGYTSVKCIKCCCDLPLPDKVYGVYEGHKEVNGVTYDLSLLDVPTACPNCKTITTNIYEVCPDFENKGMEFCQGG